MQITKKRAPCPSSKCLGPVADLEKHLPIEWWRSIFNSVYLKTDADVVENDQATKIEIDTLLKTTMLSSSAAILDLCCGQGRHSIELAKRGFGCLKGMDRSRYLIRLARQRTQKLGYSIQFSEGDARKIRLPDASLDCVMMMGNSFGYFEQELDDIKVLQEVKRVLHEKGILYLDMTDGEWMKQHFEKRSWEWIDEELLVCRERTLASDNSRLISREVLIHAEKGVLADQFYAERLYTFEQIKTQLEHVGFENIEKHQNLKGESTREQDLGMMANRTIITAVAPKKAIVIKTTKQTKVAITVLMGDPTLPDVVKRDGQFNPEDFETINKLQTALKTLPQYNFNFYNDHKNFIRKFLQHPPQFVLNLCDEGWNNKATMELHPPALMDMLNIPYSGANPECLSLCYNKSFVRAIAQEMDITVPSEIWIDPSNQSAALPSIFPAIVKPAYGDSSIGITEHAVVNTAEELVFWFDELKRTLPTVPILVQEFLQGREFSVGIIGNGDVLEILPILEVDYDQLPSHLPPILGYESKWLPDSPYWKTIRYRQAQLDDTAQKTLIDSSLNLFQRLKCRDYARFDFRMNLHNEIKLLEVNPNSSWCWDGKMTLMGEFIGLSYAQILEKIIQTALERSQLR